MGTATSTFIDEYLCNQKRKFDMSHNICKKVYKSLFAKKNGSYTKTQQNTNVNTNKATTTTKSIKVVDTLHWSIYIISDISYYHLYTALFHQKM